MSQLCERAIELSSAQIIGARLQRGDDRGGIARRALVDELCGRGAARLFARDDDFRRYRRFGPEIVDSPVTKTLEKPSIRSDASRHRDVDDDQRAPRDARRQEVGGEDRAAGVGGGNDAVGRIDRVADVREGDRFTARLPGRPFGAAAGQRDDKDPAHATPERPDRELADLAGTNDEDRRAGRLRQVA